MNVAALRDRPFCAGVLSVREGRVLLSAYEETEWDGKRIPLGATAGGGQEPGEGPEECARRETLEEVGTEAELEHASVTYVEVSSEIELRELEPPAPLLVRAYSRATAEPFRPELPAGRDVHFVVYRARLLAEPRPIAVPALLDVPLAVLPALRNGVTVEEFPPLGIALLPGSKLPANGTVHVHPDGTEDLLARVVERFGAAAVER